jgi:uncharacterized protein YjeT (DUF2065 family)
MLRAVFAIQLTVHDSLSLTTITLKSMKLFVLLIGMVLIFEGLPYVAAPESMQAWLKKISEMSPEQVRVMGLISMAIGLLLCWIIQG